MGIKQLWGRFRAWQKDPVSFGIKMKGRHVCPNCGHEFDGNYCPVCRQDAGDGRITWRWVYECIMSVWGMESRSLPNTVLQLLFRPGYLISDYISGRRQVSYTPVNMLFIVALIYVILKGLLGFDPEPTAASVNEQFEFIAKGQNWIAENPGWGVMFMTMILILPTRYLFRFAPRHTRHTLPEGIIIQIYMSTLMLVLVLFMQFSRILVLLIPFYYCFAYKQLFGYSVWGTFWRVMLCGLVWIIVFLFFILLVTLVSGNLEVSYGIRKIAGIVFFLLFMLGMAAAIVAVGYFISRHGYKKTQASR